MLHCSEYDYEYYFRLTQIDIPSILKEAYERGLKFYVKGGKAPDAYLKAKIGSPDWDVEVSPQDFEDFLNYVVFSLDPDYGSGRGTSSLRLSDAVLDLEDGTAVKVKKIGTILCGGMDYMDIAMSPVVPGKFVVIGGIPYLNPESLEEDLTVVEKSRRERAYSNETRESLQEFQKRGVDAAKKQYERELKSFKKLLERIKNETLREDLEEAFEDLEDVIGQYLMRTSYEATMDIVALQEQADTAMRKYQKTAKRLEMIKEINKNNRNIASKEYIASLCNLCREPGYKLSNIEKCGKMCNM